MKQEYFKWMCDLVCDRRVYSRNSSHYKKLLKFLYNTEFTYTIEMDGNRAADGEDLRYRFGCEKKYRRLTIVECLDTRPCSILEMMVALAIRCEEHIMEDSDIGNRTGQWFWGMIKSLGLSTMSDNNFNEYFVERIIHRFLQRDYRANGDGGLFTVPHCEQDMREVEIWYQMCMYLDTIL